MTPSPGEIWLAEIPFTDGSASKIRPVLILWLDAADCVVAAVTSAPPRSASDVPLGNWQSAGLRVSSTVRLSRLDCLEQILLLKKLGKISPNDSERIKQVWAAQIQLRF
jgi:mRNA interferase MazF